MDPVFPINPAPLPDSFGELPSVATNPIQVIEERLVVDKRIIETGRVILKKSVTERQENVAVPLNHDEVSVDRVLINRYVDIAPQAVRYEGDTMIISVLEEVVVVEKRLMLVEELHVTKRQVQTQEIRQVTLRKEDVTITRQVGADTDAEPFQ